ncbi:YifB family Mg chelatase-like AAA ATPase [Peptoniphilus equinus]|uniref:YifB family Mg chelatase-like AAA ATPase n=1 Tax=Peptoniphilus equinus TaxID=3016343 RepID=A0ABY7QSE7_9FIRM|nr:YifB family Mg chelatase-like AAA ATPase [Peptoniphilus equinus]WBW49712.1 YifB family Mg chelatase-like AAA ATPase [Peptoniphilus equinus]
MYSEALTCSLQGLEGDVITVESDLTNGLPKFVIVGLPDAAIKESIERVRSAIKNSGYEFPLKRITINLQPANLRKDGSQMDLAIAMSILSAGEDFSTEPYVIIGELSLDGTVNGVNGCLAMVISMRAKGYRQFIVPFENRKECSVVDDVAIFPVTSLKQAVSFVRGDDDVARFIGDYDAKPADFDVDFSDMKGQPFLKRALEIAAAGRHNLLMIGEPGSGKSMAAKRLPTILPPLSFEEAVEVTKIYSVAGLLKDASLITQPPFRAPHHTASAVSLIGGGRVPKPGEISLAHNGVLFLDELPEFSKQVIEVLRQPLEDKIITISRANASLTYPSDMQLIAAMNPCPCGYHHSKHHTCSCSQGDINRYLAKVSHPLLDRIDIHVEVEAVKYEHLSSDDVAESSGTVRERVKAARAVQSERYRREPFSCNADIREKRIAAYCKLQPSSQAIMDMAFKKYAFSARTYNKILKVARTIADLAGREAIADGDVLESIRYRSMDSKYWS